MENLDYVHVFEEFPRILGILDRDDAILVGQPVNLQGVVTPMDVLNYLYKVAIPFVLLAEIELSLRKLLRVSVDDDQLDECIRLTLKEKYGDDLPNSLEEMEFNDYIQIIGHGRTWPRFQYVFGRVGDWQRNRTRVDLERIRDLRNDVFHFRRELDPEDFDRLQECRSWLLMRATITEQAGGA